MGPSRRDLGHMRDLGSVASFLVAVCGAFVLEMATQMLCCLSEAHRRPPRILTDNQGHSIRFYGPGRDVAPEKIAHDERVLRLGRH